MVGRPRASYRTGTYIIGCPAADGGGGAPPTPICPIAALGGGGGGRGSPRMPNIPPPPIGDGLAPPRARAGRSLLSARLFPRRFRRGFLFVVAELFLLDHFLVILTARVVPLLIQPRDVWNPPRPPDDDEHLVPRLRRHLLRQPQRVQRRAHRSKHLLDRSQPSPIARAQHALLVQRLVDAVQIRLSLARRVAPPALHHHRPSHHRHHPSHRLDRLVAPDRRHRRHRPVVVRDLVPRPRRRVAVFAVLVVVVVVPPVARARQPLRHVPRAHALARRRPIVFVALARRPRARRARVVAPSRLVEREFRHVRLVARVVASRVARRAGRLRGDAHVERRAFERALEHRARRRGATTRSAALDRVVARTSRRPPAHARALAIATTRRRDDAMDVARAVLDGDVAALDEVVEQFYGGDSGKVRRIERVNERIGTERARERARDAPRRDRRRGRTMGRRWTGRERARARGGTKGGGNR